MADNDKGTLILIGAVVLVYLYLTKSKGTGTVLTQGSGCSSCAASSCSGCANAPTSNITTPANPASGRAVVLHGTVASGNAVNDQAGMAAPGSNLAAPGAGNNWQGVTTWRRSPLTPELCPSAPSAPFGTSANSTIQVVTA